MSWRGALREVRVMRFEAVYGRFRCGRLSCAEAADVLGMSERNFLRYAARLRGPRGYTTGASAAYRDGV